MEYVDCAAKRGRCAYQRGMTAPEMPDQLAQQLRFRARFHTHPDQPALPIIEGIDAGGAADRVDQTRTHGRRDRNAPDGCRRSIAEGMAIADLAPERAGLIDVQHLANPMNAEKSG